MKKLISIIPALLAANISYAATIWLTTGTGTTTSPGTSKYYKCNNISTISCGNFGYCQITYSSQSGGAGTSTNPYVLTSCTIGGGGCSSWKEYYTSSGCVQCANDTRSLSSAGAVAVHTNTSCEYCESDKLKISMKPAPGVSVTVCETCPSNGTCNGTTTLTCDKGYYGTSSCAGCGTYRTTKSAGATAQSACYYPKDTPLNDGMGTYIYTEDCYYQN